MKYIILIPALEPDQKLISLLQSIDKKFDAIVIDDGSGAKYYSIFNEAKKYAYVISYEENKGKGYALKTGLKYIKDKYENYIVVTMDCDGQHTIKDAITLCDFVNNNRSTLALGKREWDKHTPIRSRIGNYLTRKIYQKTTELTIYDTQTGLRAFSNKLIDYMLNTEGNRYEYEMNVLLNLRQHNIKCQEIPISTIYINKNKTSHFHPLKDSYKVYKAIFKWQRKNKN